MDRDFELLATFEKLTVFVDGLKTYPPSEIFFEKYGKEAKAEQRIQGLCESLYRFCYPDNEVNALGELSTAYRDLEVLYKVGFTGMKPNVIQDAAKAFLDAAQVALQKVDELAKKDQLLKAYFEPRKVKFQELKSIVYDVTKDYV